MPCLGTYKHDNPDAGKRRAAATTMMAEHPGCVPYAIEYMERPDLSDAERFNMTPKLVPVLRGLTVGQFLVFLRRSLDFKSSEALYLMSAERDILLCTTDWFGVLYDELKEDDGILYLCYGKENVFG